MIGFELSEAEAAALKTQDSWVTYVNAYGHSVDVFTIEDDSGDVLMMWCKEVWTPGNNLSHVFEYTRICGWTFAEYAVRNGWHLTPTG